MNRIPQTTLCAIDCRGCLSRRPVHRAWRGALLLELVISGLLLATVISAVIPALAWIARERQLTRQRQTALLEVGNVMERLTSLEWNELTPQRGAQIEPSESLREQIPDARLTVAVTDDSTAKAKRLLIELRWEAVPGRPAPPVRLVTWVYQSPLGTVDEK